MAEARVRATLAGRVATAPVRVFHFFRRWPVIPVVVLTVLITLAVFAPLVTTHHPLKGNIRERNIPPVGYAKGSWNHFLGTDTAGRDIFSRLIFGARISLMVAGVALILGLVVGVTLGLIAGYFGGVVDEIIMRVVDIWYSLPFILVAMLIVVIFKKQTAAIVGAGLPTLMVILALLVWSSYVRYIRAEVLSLRERDYVALAKVAGASTMRILFRHMLPSVINTALVIGSLRAGQVILTEASLSFLGAGIPPPTPSWGVMVADGREYLRDAWWISVFPGVAIFLLVMSLNFLGDWTRDRLDPRLRQL